MTPYPFQGQHETRGVEMGPLYGKLESVTLGKNHVTGQWVSVGSCTVQLCVLGVSRETDQVYILIYVWCVLYYILHIYI